MFLGFALVLYFYDFCLGKHKRENQRKGEENIFAIFYFLDVFGFMLYRMQEMICTCNK